MEGLNKSKEELPSEVYGALASLMKFLEEVEDKYVEAQTPKGLPNKEDKI